MTRAPKLVSPKPDEPAPEMVIETVEVQLPPHAPSFSRSDAASLACAGALHLAIVAAFMAPENRLGAGGSDPDAIGVEIITVAPALEARSTARGREQAAADIAVAETDGMPQPAVEETGAPDRLRQEARPREAAASPADLVVRDWREPPKENTASSEPVIAAVKSDAAEPQQVEPAVRPDAAQVHSPVSSMPASEVLARFFRGGAIARGTDNVAVSADAMAAARAGRRNAFQLAVYKAIVANQPVRIPGLRGEVLLHFRITRTGTVGEVRVARSSGSRALDDAAINAVRGAKVPRPSADLDEGALFFQIPMTF